MGCSTVSLGVWFQTFRMIVVPSKSVDWVETLDSPKGRQCVTSQKTEMLSYICCGSQPALYRKIWHSEKQHISE